MTSRRCTIPAELVFCRRVLTKDHLDIKDGLLCIPVFAGEPSITVDWLKRTVGMVVAAWRLQMPQILCRGELSGADVELALKQIYETVYCHFDRVFPVVVQNIVRNSDTNDDVNYVALTPKNAKGIKRPRPLIAQEGVKRQRRSRFPLSKIVRRFSRISSGGELQSIVDNIFGTTSIEKRRLMDFSFIRPTDMEVFHTGSYLYCETLSNGKVQISTLLKPLKDCYNRSPLVSADVVSFTDPRLRFHDNIVSQLYAGSLSVFAADLEKSDLSLQFPWLRDAIYITLSKLYAVLPVDMLNGLCEDDIKSAFEVLHIQLTNDRQQLSVESNDLLDHFLWHLSLCEDQRISQLIQSILSKCDFIPKAGVDWHSGQLAFPNPCIVPRCNLPDHTANKMFDTIGCDYRPSNRSMYGGGDEVKLLSQPSQRLYRLSHFITQSHLLQQDRNNPISSRCVDDFLHCSLKRDSKSSLPPIRQSLSVRQHVCPNVKRAKENSTLHGYVGDNIAATHLGMNLLFGANPLPIRRKLKDPDGEKVIIDDVSGAEPSTLLCSQSSDAPALDLVKFIQLLATEKISKTSNDKMSIFANKFNETAAVALAVLMEELGNDVKTTWKKSGRVLQFSRAELRAQVGVQLSGISIDNSFSVDLLVNRLEFLFGKTFTTEERAFVALDCQSHFRNQPHSYDTSASPARSVHICPQEPNMSDTPSSPVRSVGNVHHQDPNRRYKSAHDPAFRLVLDDIKIIGVRTLNGND